MRFLFLLWLLVASPVSAQLLPPAPLPPASPFAIRPAPPPDPADGYVTAGQDEPGYRAWYAADPNRALRVAAFNRYLTSFDVAGVVPTWQLFRSASMWQRCGAQPFEVPPTMEWPNVVQTLRYIRDYVVPAVGPVEPVSAYRNPALNACAGGAPQSAHQHFQAVDLVPMRPITRDRLMQTLCKIHIEDGSPYQVGLGFYAFERFHIDSMRFRKWGVSEANEASPCHVAIPRPAPPAPPPAAAPITAIVPISTGVVASPPASPAPAAASRTIPDLHPGSSVPALDPLAPR